jgi:glycosyltransferase involved in cell wall biosynthesis
LLSELKALAGRLSVRDSIRFLGDQPNKYAHLSMLDVFLYPTSRETYCITAAEAMAMGLLVITYRESAMPETVGDAGILVEPGDFKALATAVVDFLQNPAAWQERRALASRIALERNHPRVVIPRYEAVYSSVAR